MVIYSILFNIPKFFELRTSCPEPDLAQYSVLNHSSDLPYNISHQLEELWEDLTEQYLGNCKYGHMEISAREIRSEVQRTYCQA